MSFIAIDLFGALGDLVGFATIILFPPISVAMNPEVSTDEVYLNIILTCSGWLPGVVHAIYVLLISETRKQNKDYFTAIETLKDSKGNSVRSYHYEVYEQGEEKWEKLRALIAERPLQNVFDTAEDKGLLSDTTTYSRRNMSNPKYDKNIIKSTDLTSSKLIQDGCAIETFNTKKLYYLPNCHTRNSPQI